MRTIFCTYQNFCKRNETSKIPSTSFGGCKNFVRRENPLFLDIHPTLGHQICNIWITKRTWLYDFPRVFSLGTSVNHGKRISTYSHISTEQYFRKMVLEMQMDFKGWGNIQCGWKRRWWQRLLGWIKTSKIYNRRILATKSITNCWCSKNRLCMKSKRQ